MLRVGAPVSTTRPARKAPTSTPLLSCASPWARKSDPAVLRLNGVKIIQGVTVPKHFEAPLVAGGIIDPVPLPLRVACCKEVEHEAAVVLDRYFVAIRKKMW